VVAQQPLATRGVRCGWHRTSHYSYFGHEEWRADAAEVKSLESALAVRGRLLAAFEAAEAESSAEARDAWLTFIVVGAGPTAVEMAGQIGELARDTLRDEFRAIDPRRARILLVEAADRVLTSSGFVLAAVLIVSRERRHERRTERRSPARRATPVTVRVDVDRFG
jgi:NADH dehydrogenase